MQLSYHPKGVCSNEMRIVINNGIIENVEIDGGCNGNLKGICALVKGRPADEVIGLLGGIRCGMKNTSCPDQLSKALRQALGNTSDS